MTPKELDALNIIDQKHEIYTFNDFAISPYLLIYFYPKDLTPGCTTQAQGIQALWPDFTKMGCRVCGVSKDSPERHQKFIEKYDLPFTLLSDTDGKLCELFEVWVQKSMYGRTYMGIQRSSFLLDQNGIIQQWRNVKPAQHADLVLKFLESHRS